MADKIGGGGGFMGALNDAAGGFIDGASDMVGDAAQTAADAIKSGAEEIKEGAKGLVADAAEFGDEAIEVGQGGYDTLKELGATADRKITAAKSSIVDGASRTAEAFTNAMESASEFASSPSVRSEVIRAFLETPVSDRVEEGFKSLGYSDEQVAVAREMAGHVVDGVGRALEAGDPEAIGRGIATLINGAVEDAQRAVDGAEEDLDEALRDLNGFLDESVQYAEGCRQEVVDKLVDPALREFAQGAGLLNDLSSISLTSGAKALADTSEALQGLVVSAPKKFESFLMAVTVNGIADGMVKGEEREIGLALGVSAHLEIGGKIGASFKASIKCVDDDPLKYQLSMSRSAKVGAGFGAEALGKGASVDGVVSTREELVVEFEPGDMSQALDLASRVASGDMEGGEATRQVMKDGVGVRLESATGSFSVGVDAGGDIGVAEAEVEAWRATAEMGIGRTSAGELGAKVKISLNSGANLAAGLSSLGFDLGDADGRFSDVVQGLGVDMGMEQIRQVETIIGGDANLKGGWGASGTMELTSPPRFLDAEFKAEVVIGVDANDANLDVKVEVSMKNVGKNFSKDEFDAFLKSSSEMGALDLTMLAGMASKKGMSLEDVATVTASVVFQREDSWKYGPDKANLNGTNKLPPVTIASLNVFGSGPPEVGFEKGLDDLSAFIKSERRKDRGLETFAPQRAGYMRGVSLR